MISVFVWVGVPFVTAGLELIDKERPTALFYGLVALGALLGVLAAVRPEWAAQEARERTVDRSLRRMAMKDVDLYADLGIEMSSRERRQGDAEPPYIPRAPYDERLDAALRSRRFALLLAPHRWGSTRTAFEAARRCHPEAVVFVPADAASLGRVLDLDPPWEPPATPDRPCVLWLDRIDRYVAEGALNAAALQRLIEGRRVVVVATLASDRRSAGGDLVRFAEHREALVEIREETVTDADRAAAAELYPEADINRGIGAWFAAPAVVCRAYRDGHAPGRRLVEAAVDWRRCGLEGSMPAATLRALARERLEGHRLSEDAFAAALEWAVGEVSGTGVALLREETDGGFRADELCVDCDEGGQGAGRRPVAEVTWRLLTADATPDAALRVARAALERAKQGSDRNDRREALRACETAAKQAAAAGRADADHILGLLRYLQRDYAKAKEHWRRAWHAGSLEAANNLGILLLRDAEALEGEERANTRAEAKQAFMDCYADGPPEAARHLAAILQDEDDVVNAEDAYRHALRRNDAAAAVELGRLLEDQHRDQEAEAAYAQAEVRYRREAQEGSPAAMRRLGQLLFRRGALAEAEEWMRKAAGGGDDDAHYLLGWMLERRGAAEEAHVEYRQAAEHDHPGALARLATLADERGDTTEAAALQDRLFEPVQQQLDELGADLDATTAWMDFTLGKFAFDDRDYDQAEPHFRAAADAGHLEARFWLGLVLERLGRPAEAEEQLRRAADAGHADAKAHLGALIERDGRSDEALPLFQAAAEAGSAEGQYQFGRRRQTAGGTLEAERLYRLAAPRHPEASWALVDLLGDRATTEERRQADDWRVFRASQLEQEGDAAGAEACLRPAAEHDHPAALFELSLLLSRRGEKADAQRLRRRAADLGHRTAKMFVQFDEQPEQSG